MQSFYNEIEKIGKAKKERSSLREDMLRVTLPLIAGGTAGYLSQKGIERAGKRGKFRGAALVPAVLGAGSAIMTHRSLKEYLNERKKRRNRGKNNLNKNVLPSKQKHSKRREGYSPDVSASLLQPNARGSVQIHTGRGPIYRGNKRDGDGADNNRSGESRYGYRGKKTRYYRFKDPT